MLEVVDLIKETRQIYKNIFKMIRVEVTKSRDEALEIEKSFNKQ